MIGWPRADRFPPRPTSRSRCRRRCTSATARSRCRSSPSRAPAPTRCSSRCRTAASAAPTCTSCSRSTPTRHRCSVTSGRARSRRSAPTSSGWELGARGRRRTRRPGCGECRACRRGPAVGVPAARAARPTSTSARRVLPLQGRRRGAAAARPRRALDARRRAHRADRDRDPHRQPVGRHARRPRARHRRRSGRPAHDRGAARAGVDDITVSEPAPLRRERALAVGAARVVAPDELPRAPMGRRSPSRSRSRSSARATRARGGVGARPARLRGHARVRRHRPRHAAHQPQPRDRARAHDASARTTTTPKGFAPALELLASGALPLDLLIEADDVLLDDVLAHDAPPRRGRARPAR